MFNLLVRPDPYGWDDSNEYYFPGGRVLRSSDAVVSKYRKDPRLSRTTLPCLFSYEGFNGHGRIGRISSVSRRGSSVGITYALDSRFPPIPIHDEETYRKFGCEGWDCTTTHWAVKDIDLFEVVAELLAKQLPDFRESEAIIDKIWGQGSRRSARIFLSHRAKDRTSVSKVAERLKELGHRTFVAHDDIRATKEWRDEILHALNTMTHFVGLVADGFHEGSWTDQEIGYAFARRKDVKKLFVRLSDVVPQGLASFEQAAASDWSKAANRIDELMRQED